MNKNVLIILSLLLTIILISCDSTVDETYIRMDLLDDKLGYLMVPNNWYIEEIDDWMYIKNNSDDTVIAIEYKHGSKYYDSNTIVYREIVNPYFDDYTSFSVVESLSGNSNLAQLARVQFDINKDIEQFYYFFLGSRNDDSYKVSFVVLDTTIDKKILQDIMKTYVAISED